MVQTAILARMTRSAVLEVLREDFVRTARAKGLGQHAVLWGHVLRNALVPVFTLWGLQFANLLAGAIVVENVFYLPGLGRLMFQAIANRDLMVVRNCVMLLAAMVIVVNFVVDVLYAWHRSASRVKSGAAMNATGPAPCCSAGCATPSFVIGGILTLALLVGALLSLIWTP